MNKQARTIVLFLGVAAIIFVVIKLVSARSKAAGEERFKKTYAEDLVAQQVWCDSCQETSDLDVMFKDKGKFQVCPNCGEKTARPIVYLMCTNKDCNRKLFKVANHVMVGTTFMPSPDPFVCPECGRKDTVYYEPIHFNKAKKIADETGQQFP